MATTTYFTGTGALAGVDFVITRPRKIPVVLGWILILHGINGSCTGARQGGIWGNNIQYLADKGFGLLAPSMPNWPSSASRTLLDNIWTYYQTLPDKYAKINVLATSDGAGQFLDALPLTPTRYDRAWLDNPLTDPKWAYSYGAATGHYYDGSTIPYTDTSSQPSWFPSDMNTNFAGNWPANSTGYRINNNYAAYRGLGVRTMIDQASDDAVLPPAASPWFAAQVADSNMTVRSPSRTGGHVNTNLLSNAELEAWFRKWTP